MRNTRFITAIIAFAGTFAVSVGLVWLLFGFPVKQVVNFSDHNCSQRHAGAIYSHLSRDISNGRQGDARSFQTNNREDAEISYSIRNHANSVADYVEDSNSLSVDHLPQDFQAAWQRHIDAWQDYSEFLNEMKKASANTKINQRSFEVSDNRYTDEINATWYEVLRIGRNHGADVE